MAEIISGIYGIINPNGEIYIGRSSNIYKRWACHKTMPDRWPVKLYESFKKFGIENHVFEIVHACPVDELVDKEFYYIAMLNTTKSGLNKNF